MTFGLLWDIRFNPVKNQNACFGSKFPVCDCINIGGEFIPGATRSGPKAAIVKSRVCARTICIIMFCYDLYVLYVVAAAD